MTIVLWSAFTFLTVTYIVRPMLAFSEARQRKLLDTEMRAIKMRAIQNAYPILRNMSWDEIERKFPIQSLYDEIGR